MPKNCKLTQNLLRRIIAIALLAIAGCATPYQPEKGFGLLKLEGGFFEQNVRKAEWFIGFRGNAKVSQEKARDFCLLRASELCIESGYEWFEIVEELVDIDQFSSRRPSITRTMGDTSGRASNSTSRGPIAVTRTMAYKMHIRGHDSEGPDTNNSYEVQKSISYQYDI